MAIISAMPLFHMYGIVYPWLVPGSHLWLLGRTEKETDRLRGEQEVMVWES